MVWRRQVPPAPSAGSAHHPEGERQGCGGTVTPDSKGNSSSAEGLGPPSFLLLQNFHLGFALLWKAASPGQACCIAQSVLLHFLRSLPVKLPGNMPETSSSLCLSGRPSTSQKERFLSEVEGNLCRIQDRQKRRVTISSCLWASRTCPLAHSRQDLVWSMSSKGQDTWGQCWLISAKGHTGPLRVLLHPPPGYPGCPLRASWSEGKDQVQKLNESQDGTA